MQQGRCGPLRRGKNSELAILAAPTGRLTDVAVCPSTARPLGFINEDLSLGSTQLPFMTPL